MIKTSFKILLFQKTKKGSYDVYKVYNKVLLCMIFQLFLNYFIKNYKSDY